MIALFKMPSEPTARGPSGVPRHKKAVTCLREKTYMLDMLHSGLSYSAIGHEFNVMNQQYILNKVSLNRDTQTNFTY